MVGWLGKRHVSVKWAIFFLSVGLILLVGALLSAYFFGPSNPRMSDGKTVERYGFRLTDPIDDIGAKACAKRVGDAVDPGGEAFRLIDVHPSKTEIGRHLCLVVAGAVPPVVVSSAQKEVDEKSDDLTKARQALATAETATPPSSTSQLEKLRKNVTDAESALNEALASQRVPVSLTLYLNNAKVPIEILAQPTYVKQPLYVELAAPDNATDTDAQFWRDLVRGSASWDGSFGEVEVAVGLSRTVGAADLPETGAGSDRAVSLYVFSLEPIVLGLAALASLAIAFCFYAYGAPILRDNALTRSMLPGELEAAKLGLEEAIANDAKARKDLADAKAGGGPVDSSLYAAAAATAAAVNQARNRVGRVIGALGQSPEVHKKAQESLAAATAALDAATAAGAATAANAASPVVAEVDKAAGGLKSLSGLEAARRAVKDADPQQLAAAKAAEAAALALDGAMDDLVATTIAMEEARGAVVAALNAPSLLAPARNKLTAAETLRSNAEAKVSGFAGTAKVDAAKARRRAQDPRRPGQGGRGRFDSRSPVHQSRRRPRQRHEGPRGDRGATLYARRQGDRLVQPRPHADGVLAVPGGRRLRLHRHDHRPDLRRLHGLGDLPSRHQRPHHRRGGAHGERQHGNPGVAELCHRHPVRRQDGPAPAPPGGDLHPGAGRRLLLCRRGHLQHACLRPDAAGADGPRQRALRRPQDLGPAMIRNPAPLE